MGRDTRLLGSTGKDRGAGNLNIKYILNLRHIPRTGWLLRGVPPAIAENVADHIFLTSIIAMDIASRLSNMGVNIDVSKVLMMSILHDIPEVVTGDIVRYVKTRVEDYFSEIESEALETLGLQRYRELYTELSNSASLEALVVKVADDIATILEGMRLVENGYTQVSEIVENVKAHLNRVISEKIPGEVRDSILTIIGEYLESVT